MSVKGKNLKNPEEKGLWNEFQFVKDNQISVYCWDIFSIEKLFILSLTILFGVLREFIIYVHVFIELLIW